MYPAASQYYRALYQTGASAFQPAAISERRLGKKKPGFPAFSGQGPVVLCWGKQGAFMKTLYLFAALAFAAPALAQEAPRSLPPGSFQFDRLNGLKSFEPPTPVGTENTAELPARPLPADSYKYDACCGPRIDLRPFDGPARRAPLPAPEAKPEPKPQKALG
jgi:hypothetical protein